jgi:hypothetical protein
MPILQDTIWAITMPGNPGSVNFKFSKDHTYRDSSNTVLGYWWHHADGSNAVPFALIATPGGNGSIAPATAGDPPNTTLFYGSYDPTGGTGKGKLFTARSPGGPCDFTMKFVKVAT